MRIEIEDSLGDLLDEIKAKEYRIYGKGHSETVRFLVGFYKDAKSLEALVESKMETIGQVVEEANLRVVKQVLRNIFNLASSHGE